MKRLIKKAEIKEFYHGTSSNRVDSILSSGLKITDGGFGDGSYVTANFDEARKYALKRAGEFKKASTQYPQYTDVEPVVLVVKIDDSELKHGFQDIYFAEEGIGADKIVEVRDISNDASWQDLVTYVELYENGNEEEKEQALEAYQRYYAEVAAIV